MGGTRKHGFRYIVFLLRHTGNTASASVLCLILCCHHSLDISHVRKSHNACLFGDKVFDIHFTGYIADLRAAIIAVFICDCLCFLFYEGENL